MPSGKKQLSCRVSDETYREVLAIVGDNTKPYKSTSEYLYTLIIRDLGERRAGRQSTTDMKPVLDYLKSDEGIEVISKLVAERLIGGKE